MTIYLKIRMRTNYIKKIKDVKIIYKKKNISQNNLFCEMFFILKIISYIFHKINKSQVGL